MYIGKLLLEQKRQIIGILELICRQLELTETQFKDAESKYKAVGAYLEKSEDIKVFYPVISPQGSMRYGTTVRPIGRDEFDLDLVCNLTAANPDYSQVYIRNLIGDWLRKSEIYGPMLEPLNRGWRLNYAKSSKFHLDITPAVPIDPSSDNGLVVPDKELKSWKPSNPEGYAKWFEKYAELVPQNLMEERRVLIAKVDPLPQQTPFKSILKRCVQIYKRHRDKCFQKLNSDDAPISVIITTLAAKSYGKVIYNHHDSELDLLYDVIAHMPEFIEITDIGNKRIYNIPNETVQGENFAEKWNTYPERAKAFYYWQKTALTEIDKIGEKAGQGIDAIHRYFSEMLGESVTDKAFNEYTNIINQKREKGTLSVITGTGLSSVSNGGTKSRDHTFYGK